ncbi:Amidase 1 [Spatholobus suberectus]|nr:Amidase 1 [Spatholobus suberectus]
MGQAKPVMLGGVKIGLAPSRLNGPSGQAGQAGLLYLRVEKSGQFGLVRQGQIMSYQELCKVATRMGTSLDYRAFMKRFILQLNPSHHVPLNSLTFVVKDMFDVKGHMASFGNPNWVRTHSTTTSIAPIVLAFLEADATCVGTTIMDELAYIFNMHYGTPRNPCATDWVPRGSFSGSVVVVGVKLVDFSIGTNCLGSIGILASYYGIFGVRPSYGVIPKLRVILMAQSFDTVINYPNLDLNLFLMGKTPTIAPTCRWSR